MKKTLIIAVLAAACCTTANAQGERLPKKDVHTFYGSKASKKQTIPAKEQQYVFAAQ